MILTSARTHLSEFFKLLAGNDKELVLEYITESHTHSLPPSLPPSLPLSLSHSHVSVQLRYLKAHVDVAVDLIFHKGNKGDLILARQSVFHSHLKEIFILPCKSQCDCVIIMLIPAFS